MKRITVGAAVVMLAFSGTVSFAQIRDFVNSAKNLRNLAQVIANARSNSRKITVVGVPTSVVRSGIIGLKNAPTPSEYTPVTASLINYRRRPVFKFNVWGKIFPVYEGNRVVGREHIVGRGFYRSATALANDLHLFYGGKGAVWMGRKGNKVKFYAMPMNGILFQPEGWSKPLVLNSEDYFVTYDIETQQGRILENRPSVYEAYERFYEEEPLQFYRNSAPGQHATSGGSNFSAPADVALSWRKNTEETPLVEEQTPRISLEESLEIYSGYSQEVAALRQTGLTNEWWEELQLAKQYDSGMALGSDVVRFYNNYVNMPAIIQVKQLTTGKVGKIYEFPVEGLEIHLRNGNIIRINPEESVLFYGQDNTFNLIQRDRLMDLNSFELITR